MRVESLTFLRFLAAILVVFFHYGNNTALGGGLKSLISLGPQMVTFFFTLSGFVLAIAYLNKKQYKLFDFYIARIARIAPIYMLALFFVFYSSYGGGINDLYALLLNISFLQTWVPPYALSFNSPGWSLSVEMFFYLTFPAVLFLIKERRVSEGFFVFFSVFIYILTQVTLSSLLNSDFYQGWPSESHDLIYYLPLSHYCSFLLGISGGLLYVRSKLRFNYEFRTLAMISFVLFITYYSLTNAKIFIDIFDAPLAFGGSFYSIFFVVLIFVIAVSNNFVTRLLSKPVFVLLGEASYSIYILQMPFYYFYSKYLSKSLNLNPELNFYTYMISLVVLSVITFKVIEVPSRKLIMKFSLHRRNVVLAK
ncbi:acyltransferase [Photobacterium frigidiphilum]|uniref:acyltransferase family protein n=1 Tax=Photobacterium frigidiphilum TaxID=264736 RepID=UPI003D1411EA